MNSQLNHDADLSEIMDRPGLTMTTDQCSQLSQRGAVGDETGLVLVEISDLLTGYGKD